MAIPSLNIGGGKWATKQDKLLAYKQNIGGRYFAINGDTSRNSTATFTNQNGLIESVGNNVARVDFQDDVKGSLLLEPQSTNLITQSESFGNSYWTKSRASIEGDPSTAGVEEVVNGDFATDTDWTKGTGWAISGGVASCDGTNTASIDQVISSLELNKNYLISFDISNYISGTITTYLPFGVPNLGSFSGDNTYTVQVNVSTLATKNIYFKSNSFIGSIDNVSVKEVQGFASPSLDSPTGAFKLVEDTSTGSKWVYTSPTVTSGQSYTYSVIAKKGGRDFLLLNAYSNGNNRNWFDLNTGTLGTSESGVSKIESIGNGWYRCSVTITTVLGTQFFIISPSISDNSSSYTGDGTSGVYIFGAQLEALPYATSYIPTNGSTVTRVQDVANNFGDVNTFNSEEGTLFVECSGFTDSAARLISLSDGTNTNRMYIGYSSTFITAVVVVGGGLSYVYNFVSSGVSDTVKIALTYKENDFTLYVNGVKKNFQLSGSIYPVNILNRLSFDSGAGASNFYGETKQVQVYKEALTDAELITLTASSTYTELAQVNSYNLILDI